MVHPSPPRYRRYGARYYTSLIIITAEKSRVPPRRPDWGTRASSSILISGTGVGGGKALDGAGAEPRSKKRSSIRSGDEGVG
jgi:hypothetical protein